MLYHFGLIAKDIHNSATPMVYGAFSRDLGISSDFQILNILPEQLAETLEYARSHFRGFNVTMPYKQSVLPYMDELDESAAKCGSANVVLVRDGKLIAYNTDGWGLIRALEDQGIALSGKRIVMLGAGGVACSIAYSLSTQNIAGADVLNPVPERAQALCSRFGPDFAAYTFTEEQLGKCCKGADLFINASVVGQLGYPDFESLDFLDGLSAGAAVFDVNYSNPASRLVPAAAAKGLAAFKGRRMTACQGIRAIGIWTGREPSKKAVDTLISQLEQLDAEKE